MSLFGTLQLAGNSLQAQQIGLQVVGQNMANANTPGYSREQVLLTPAPTQQLGQITLGTGVEVQGVVQKVDEFLNERLRNANSDVASSTAEQQTYSDLEGIVGALQKTSIDGSMNDFFSSIAGILNQPENVSARNLAVLKGQALTGAVNNLYTRVSQERSDINNQVVNMASQINGLTTQIAQLNTQITETEGGDPTHSQAVGLRDQRNEALTQLSNLIGITVQEQPSGADNVYVGPDYLVFEGTSQSVETNYTTDRGLSIAGVNITSTNSPLQTQSGQLAGLINSRDTVLGGYEDQLNSFVGTLANEFNKVFSSGQGLTGYTTATSTNAVTSTTAPLDAAGLPFTPVNGSFQVQLLNKQTGLTTTTNVPVDLNGLDKNETSLTSLVAQFNAINGLSASISPSGNVTINTTSPDLQFSFANDTSGTLAALGLNTFFTGSTAQNLGVNQALVNDPSKFAASTTGIGPGTDNAVTLANFINQPLASAGNSTIQQVNDQIVGDVTQQSAVAKSVADGYNTFQQTLTGQQLSISGVSIDEEATNMITLERSYQASAKLISTINDLLDTLMKL
ncbi:MAG TPA: flagellar hook-associated protein FlgK [Pirellulales bacterium]|nr:flagellar hook-associated protein FlgK [Pirellulales bacterium]